MKVELNPQIVQKEVDCKACITGNGYHTCNQTVKIERSVELKDNKFIMTTKEDGKLLETEELTDREYNKAIDLFGVKKISNIYWYPLEKKFSGEANV